MGITVKGTQRLSVEVEINKDELIRALWSITGMTTVNPEFSNNNRWYKTDDGLRLIEEQDISYHGSPCYMPTGDEITDPLKIKQYDLIRQLTETFKEQEEQSNDPV